MKISLIILILVMALILYGARQMKKEKRRKNKKLNLAGAFNTAITHYRLLIDHSETIGDRIVGLDKRNKKLLVVDHSENNKQEECIDLRTVSGTAIIEVRDEHGSIRKIYLQLNGRKNNALFKVCFFDDAVDPIVDLPGFAKRSMHWKNRVDIHKRHGYASLDQEYLL
jgi:type II secretory pathway pseudopilin PulG